MGGEALRVYNGLQEAVLLGGSLVQTWSLDISQGLSSGSVTELGWPCESFVPSLGLSFLPWRMQELDDDEFSDYALCSTRTRRHL